MLPPCTPINDLNLSNHCSQVMCLGTGHKLSIYSTQIKGGFTLRYLTEAFDYHY